MGTWTRNYTNILASFFAGPSAGTHTGGTASYTSSNLTAHLTDGTYRKINNNNNECYNAESAPQAVTARMAAYAQLNLASSSATLSRGDYVYIAVGSGSVEGDTYDISALNAPITSGLTLASSRPTVTVEYDSTNHKYTKTYSYGITNTSNGNISIRELALETVVGGGYNYYDCPAIIYYDTFEAITLEPYESIVVTISQSFPLINYEPYPE